MKGSAPSALEWEQEARRSVPLHPGSWVDLDTQRDHEPQKVAEPSRLCQFGLQQRCFCGETPQPPWWFMGSEQSEPGRLCHLAAPLPGSQRRLSERTPASPNNPSPTPIVDAPNSGTTV